MPRDRQTFTKSPSLRHKPTPAEQVLWPYLRERKILGYKFLRQYPIGSYFADFYCVEAKFVIEVDGPIHDLPEQREYDQIRQKALEDQGIVVLRIRNEEITDNIIQTLKKIKEAMRKLN